jgi:hypothetical protein
MKLNEGVRVPFRVEVDLGEVLVYAAQLCRTGRRMAAGYNHGGTWSNRPYVALALFSLLATCEVF